MPVIREEQEHDVPAVRHVQCLAFGRDSEANLVDALRLGGHAKVSLVAEEAGQIAGHILFSDLPIVTPETTLAGLALAPVAVLPRFQRRAIGSQLIRQGLAVCRERDFAVVIVLGNPAYYRRFGFSVELARPLDSPFAGDAMMALELIPGVLSSTTARMHYPPPFFDL